MRLDQVPDQFRNTVSSFYYRVRGTQQILRSTNGCRYPRTLEDPETGQKYLYGVGMRDPVHGEGRGRRTELFAQPL